jgi:hypothetical protein
MRFSIALLFAAALGAEPLVDVGYRQMYNLRFDEAHRTFERFELEAPEDPLGPVSNAAAYVFAEFDRLSILQSEFFTQDAAAFKASKKLSPDPQVREALYGELAKADRLADAMLARSPNEKNALFAKILIIGLRADYEGLVEKRIFASLRALKDGRQLAERLLAVDPSYYDAYLAIGVENYLLSLKPAPVRWMLQLGGAQTDPVRGVEKLRLTAEKGHYLRPYARLLMAVVALREHDRNTAIAILQDLVKQYPQNRLYSEELARIRKTS